MRVCHGQSQDGFVELTPSELFLSGVLPEEGSPPPSSTPDIIFSRGHPNRVALLFFALYRERGDSRFMPSKLNFK